MLYHLRTWLAIALIVYALVRWWHIPKPRTPLFRSFGALTAAALALESTGYLAVLLDWQVSVLYNLFVILELAIIMRMVQIHLPARAWIGLVGFAVGLVGMARAAYITDPFGNTLFEGVMVAATVEAVLLMGCLVRMALHSHVVLYRSPEFMLFMGLLVYCTGLVPILGLGRLLYERDKELAGMIWSIVPMLVYLRYLLSAYACSLEARRVKG